MKSLKTLTTYAAALASALCWLAVLKLACVCDKETRQAVASGARIDRVDEAIARLDALYVAIFGNDE